MTSSQAPEPKRQKLDNGGTTHWICRVGECGLLLRFGTCIDLEVSKKVLACMSKLEKSTPVDGVGEVLPAYASLLVHFDPLKVSGPQVEQWCQDVIAVSEFDRRSVGTPRCISIPVRYGGEGGPDIDQVAHLTGLASASEVARVHAEGEYRVYFLGFMGGFPYLGGLRPPLNSVPRLSTPRQKLPKGTVGIAGGQTGVYTVSTPGGWHCLGRTPMKLFDPSQDPPAMLRAGDLVKFFSSDKDIPEGDDIIGEQSPPIHAKPWIKIVSPGPMTTVQDIARHGYARHGVSRSGAADDLSLRMGNALLGNEDGSAGLEVTMGGLKMRCIEPCAIALTGADCVAKLKRLGRNSKLSLRINEVVLLQSDDEIELGFATDAMRAYVSVRGGVDVPVVLGSRSTDVRGGLGGFQGRPLKKGDILGRLTAGQPPLLSAVHDPLRRASTPSAGGAAGKTWQLRVLPGPGDPGTSPGATDVSSDELLALLDGEFNVLPRSDRMAVCASLVKSDGANIVSSSNKLVGGQQMSEPCVTGTIQLPPDGNPVILLAEHQTTGGYKVPAIVIKADIWQVGQMRPGDRIRFVQTTSKEAITILSNLRAQARETKPMVATHSAGSFNFSLRPRAGHELHKIDLNADAGEGFDDAGLLQYVTSVNVACGGHAGTTESIAHTVALAAAAGAGIGAHVSFVDKEGFGRRALDTPPQELRNQVLWQTSALDGLCRGVGRRVNYIKPHGALYHVVMAGGDQGGAVWEAAQMLQLPLLLMPRSPWATFGEGFAERAYDGDSLRPRDQEGAVIHDPQIAAQQAVALAARADIHSICVHGDSPNAVAVAKAVRSALVKEFRMVPFLSLMEAEMAEPGQIALASDPQLENQGLNIASSSCANAQTIRSSIRNILEHQVAPVIVNGYRQGEGIEPTLYPVPRLCETVESLMADLCAEVPSPTAYTKFARGEATYEEYIKELRMQLAKQGGGWVTVAPRDTVQQGNDSESAAITNCSRMNSEIWAARAGCVGYETGGAQYQAGLIRGFDPAAILALGLPCNIPAHSLQRSQYVNGLAELTTDVRQALFDATAQVVTMHYRRGANAREQVVPWQPYNFHAGNFYNEATGYSPQDETTAELLKARCFPIPVWVFSAKFPIEHLKKWTARQVDLFAKAGRTLHCVRIKNPGQGKDWTSNAVWTHAKTMIAVFKEKNLEPPIIYVHNHDFNGMGAHVGAEVFRMAQAEGFNYMVIDAGYRKNGTHNDNTVLLSALKLTTEQQEALVEWNHNQQQIENILCRFNSRNSQMTPWDSDWAGGTEGSDIRIAKTYGLDVRKINNAKEVASEVFPLERAVTPFSEYKLRLGLGIMIEDGIQPKTADAVRAWVNGGGKLKVGGDVLIGLRRWETLVPKPPEVDKLLANMLDELDAAMAQKSKLITPADLPDHFTAAQRHIVLGYQAKGLEFVSQTQMKSGDLSPLLLAPHVLHRERKTLTPGTKFQLLSNPSDYSEVEQVTFAGFGTAPTGELILEFSHEGATATISMSDPDAVKGGQVATGPRKVDASNANEFACEVPGELVSYAVKEGELLVEGEPLCTLESMKMEIVISVPSEIAGKVVKSLTGLVRTTTAKGEMFSPGDLLLEVHSPR